MKRYFLEGKEISEQEAVDIERMNDEYMKSGDFDLMLKCKCRVVINY